MFGLSGFTPTLDDLKFDTDGFSPIQVSNPRVIRAWRTPDGDGVGIYLFNVPPDLPVVAKNKDYATHYSKALGPSGGKVVECSRISFGAVGAVSVIFKVPQQPAGMTFVGSITLPFRDFSFVVKAQCEDRDISGLRETVLLDRHLGAGGDLNTFSADDRAFDAEFPQSPLSRVRRVLDRVQRTLRLDRKLAESPGWNFPKN